MTSILRRVFKLFVEQISLFIEFLGVLSWYFTKKGKFWGEKIETRKDFVVDKLMFRRGVYQRPFLHAGMTIIAVMAMSLTPVLANTYPGLTSPNPGEDTPPSAVLNTATGSEPLTITQISDKPRDEVVTYTVKSGDTLSSIGRDYGVSIDTIRWANENTITSIHDISPGQKLLIPPVTGLVVKVKKGETIYTIAKKYDTNAQKIVDFPFNNFTDTETFALAEGQTLVVPDGVIQEVQLWAAAPAKPIDISKMTAGGSGQYIWPTAGVITQYRTWYHTGLDIANPAAPAITAADSGRVIVVIRGSTGYGWHVIVDHGNGFSTLYGHLQAIYVEPGQDVTRGQMLGKMGSTGRSTGTHLHFEVRVNGAPQDPLSYLK